MMTGSVTSLVIVLLLSFLERCHFFHTRFLSQQKKQIYYKGSNNNNNNMPQMDWDPKAAPKLDFSEDYYTILEISDNCNPTQLKKQYYKLVFKYHPDNKQSDEEKELCNRQMMVINNAYKILKDDHTRKQYNNQRAIGNFGTKARVKTQKMDDDSTQSTSNNKSASSKTSTSASASTSSSNAYTGSKSSSSTYSSTSSRGKDDSSFDDFFQRIYDKSSTTTTTRSPSSSSSAQSESVESLGDILSDLWKDISLDGGRNVLEDLVDFLEEKVMQYKISHIPYCIVLLKSDTY